MTGKRRFSDPPLDRDLELPCSVSRQLLTIAGSDRQEFGVDAETGQGRVDLAGDLRVDVGPSRHRGHRRLLPGHTHTEVNAGSRRAVPKDSIMTVLLITALHAAETLAKFHQEQADKMPPGGVQDHHHDMTRRCLADVEDIRHQVVGAGVTVEHQADAVRRRDLETALKIIERHPITHGIAMAVDAVAAARVAMARDIADALAAARGGQPS
jgi:hypothetical protein